MACYLNRTTQNVLDSLSSSWAYEIERIYSKHVEDALSTTLLARVSRLDLMKCAESGSSDSVRQKIFIVMSSFYSWATDMGHIDRNILSGIRRFKGPRSRDRVLDDRELNQVWISTFKLPEPWGRFGRLMILSGQRRGEVAKARWKEINIEKREWIIPKERMKGRNRHVVALTTAMLEQLGPDPKSERYIFESNKVGGMPISGFSKIVKNTVLHCLFRPLWVKSGLFQRLCPRPVHTGGQSSQEANNQIVYLDIVAFSSAPSLNDGYRAGTL